MKKLAATIGVISTIGQFLIPQLRIPFWPGELLADLFEMNHWVSVHDFSSVLVLILVAATADAVFNSLIADGIIALLPRRNRS